MNVINGIPPITVRYPILHTGPAAAFFDMDFTILSASSSVLYIKYMRRHRLLSRRQLALAGWWTLQYKLGRLNFPKLTARVMRIMNPEDESATRTAMARWFHEDVLRHVTARARQRIAEHQAAGHHVAILSATTAYVVEPLAQLLGLSQEQALCTRLEVADGRFTGNVIDPPCYGAGKVHWANVFVAQHAVDLAHSYFYTDSYSDRPLLDEVGYPVAVNPDRRLKRYAQRKHWPIEWFY